MKVLNARVKGGKKKIESSCRIACGAVTERSNVAKRRTLAPRPCGDCRQSPRGRSRIERNRIKTWSLSLDGTSFPKTNVHIQSSLALYIYIFIFIFIFILILIYMNLSLSLYCINLSRQRLYLPPVCVVCDPSSRSSFRSVRGGGSTSRWVSIGGHRNEPA